MSPKETTAATLPDELDELMKPEEETEPTPVVESDGDVIVDIDDDRATDQTKPDSREPEPAPEDKAPEGTDPDSDQTPPKMDSDHDGLSDELELMVGTNLLEADTDGDGLTDGFEYFSQVGLDPKLADTDGDESKDGEELLFKTDPTNVDTDGDGLQDGRDLLPTDATNTLGIPQGATSTDPRQNPRPSELGVPARFGPVTSRVRSTTRCRNRSIRTTRTASIRRQATAATRATTAATGRTRTRMSRATTSRWSTTARSRGCWCGRCPGRASSRPGLRTSEKYAVGDPLTCSGPCSRRRSSLGRVRHREVVAAGHTVMSSCGRRPRPRKVGAGPIPPIR